MESHLMPVVVYLRALFSLHCSPYLHRDSSPSLYLYLPFRLSIDLHLYSLPSPTPFHLLTSPPTSQSTYLSFSNCAQSCTLISAPCFVFGRYYGWKWISIEYKMGRSIKLQKRAQRLIKNQQTVESLISFTIIHS
jgi:hypothetical protein